MATRCFVGMLYPLGVGSFTDAKGNPTTVDPNVPPQFAVAPSEAGEIVPCPPGVDGVAEGTPCYRVLQAGPADAPVTAQIQGTVDADRGDGNKPLVLVGDVENEAGEARTGTISIGGGVPDPTA